MRLLFGTNSETFAEIALIRVTFWVNRENFSESWDDGDKRPAKFQFGLLAIRRSIHATKTTTSTNFSSLPRINHHEIGGVSGFLFSTAFVVFEREILIRVENRSERCAMNFNESPRGRRRSGRKRSYRLEHRRSPSNRKDFLSGG